LPPENLRALRELLIIEELIDTNFNPERTLMDTDTMQKARLNSLHHASTFGEWNEAGKRERKGMRKIRRKTYKTYGDL